MPIPMPTDLATKVPTLTQRITVAYERADSIVRPADSKRLAAALVEIAVEEIERNPGFLPPSVFKAVMIN